MLHVGKKKNSFFSHSFEKMLSLHKDFYSNMKDYNRFAGIAVADFVDLILMGDDEAMYHLLHERLVHRLKERYETYKSNLYDDFEDVIDDFFLDLRESGRNPYQALQRIKKKEAFEAWLLNTFRNYLSNRAETEYRLLDYSEQASYESDESYTNEQKMQMASNLIAYAYQVFYPRSRFIFLRSLLTMLNKQKALPDKEMAETLQMTYLSYRVTCHRMKCNLINFRNCVQQGENLCLDAERQQMAECIYHDFGNLYPTLLKYYNQAIDDLKCADDIRKLRQSYYEATGMMVHEPDPSYSFVMTASGFWRKLNRMLICN